jgi:hypothetical protein
MLASLALAVPLATAPAAPAIAAPHAAPLTAPATAPPAAPVPSAEPEPIDFAVVVDESGSISAPDIAHEKAAASLLTQGEIAAGSRAIVIGFGSSNRQGQSPVDEVCPLTVLDEAGRQQVASCVGRLRSRRPDEGNGTDLPSAIQQAVTRLAEAPGQGRPRIVFLLTDGKLDVSDSPQYGESGHRNEAAQERLDTEVLPDARRQQVQIWPLGFSAGPDEAALKAIAAGGYQNNCPNVPNSTPLARRVNSSDEVATALQQVFAAARCLRFRPGTQGLPPTDLSVTISPIATDGSIEVVKQDPAVVVTYYDPRNQKVPTDQPAFDGSRIELSGQNTPVEALRIQDPRPGTWRIHLDAPPGHRGKLASSSVLWQGVLHSTISMNPASPVAGERTAVEVRLQTRRGVVISDPADLAGIRVSVRLSGTGFAPVDAELADTGAAPDQAARDGRFAGYLTVPAAAAGPVSLVGNSVAEGVTGDHRPYDTVVLPTPSKVTATATFDQRTVHPGERIGGTLIVRNSDTVPHTLSLTLTDLDQQADLAVGPSTVQVPAGSQQPVPFTLAFGKRSPLGDTAGKIVITDTTADRVLSDPPLPIRVEPPPTFLEKWWWLLVLLALALVLSIAAVLGWRRKRQRSRSPNGLVLELHPSQGAVSTFTIGHAGKDGFGFAIGEESNPAIQPRLNGAPYRIRRDPGTGGVVLRTPRRGAQVMRVGERVGVRQDLELLILDPGRRTTPGRPGMQTAGRPPRRGSDTKQPAGKPDRGAAARAGTAIRKPAQHKAAQHKAAPNHDLM